MEYLFYDTSAFILKLLDCHWILIGVVWGSFKIYAKRSKSTADDEFVKVVEELKR